MSESSPRSALGGSQSQSRSQSQSPEDSLGTDEPDESPDRLITLSDGIFAIAMTLLVLNISIPSGLDHADFIKSLHSNWSAIGAYALTFAITAGRWRDHHRIFQLIRRTNAAVVRLTLVLLGVVALLPFPTALLSEYGGHEPLAIAYYAATLGILNVLLLALFRTVRNDERLQARAISDRLARAMYVDFGTATAIAVAAVVAAFAVSPTVGLLIWLAAVPSGLAAQRLRRGA